MYVSVGELALNLALCALAGAAIAVAIFALLRNRLPSPTIALITLALLLWLGNAETLADQGVLIGVRSLYAILALSLITAASIVWLARTDRNLTALLRTACLLVIALPLIALAEYATRRISIGVAVKRSALLQAATTPLAAGNRTAPGFGRDVYLLILDGYPRPKILAERFGFDDSAFSDSLRKLGLTVATEGRSNYGFTAPSLASLFSGEHVRSIEQDPYGKRAPWNVFYEVIRRSPVLSAFARAGYRVYLVPSAYFPGTRTTAVGEVYLPTNARNLLMRAARGELARWLMHATVPGRILEKTGATFMPNAVALAPFTGMAELVARPGPKIVVAHSLIAHFPYFFDEQCVRTHPARDDAIAFAEQIRCTNGQVLQTIREIERGDSASTIVVLADHGTWGPGPDIGAPAESITPSQAVERFGAFRATRLPAGVTIPDTSTQLNVIRRVVSATLGIDLPDVADSSYWSSFAALDHFVAVDSLFGRADQTTTDSATRAGRR